MNNFVSGKPKLNQLCGKGVVTNIKKMKVVAGFFVKETVVLVGAE